jgi:hypothetical protein
MSIFDEKKRQQCERKTQLVLIHDRTDLIEH